MGRWLGTSVAIVALALVGCAHPSPAPPPPSVTTHAPPAPPPPPSPPPRPCAPPLQESLGVSLPACAGVPADLLDAARIKQAPLGSRVSVRGFLVLGEAECTLMACSTTDRQTGERRRNPCCNGCQAFWRLAGLDGASATAQAPSGPQIFLKQVGSRRPLETSAIDCVIHAIAASPRAEIIASGRLEPARMDGYLGPGASGVLAIEDVTLCATGRRSPPRGRADGDLPGCR